MKQFRINLFPTAQDVVKKSTVAMLCMLLAGLFLAVSCEKPKEKNYPFAITPILVSKKSYLETYTPTPQQNLVIKTSTEWKNFTDNIYEYALEFFFVDIADTNINFSKHQVIAVIDECCCPIRSIDITDITEYADKIVVTYTNLDTTKSIAAVAWQPYHIVKIPKSKKNVIFNYDEEMKGKKELTINH